MGSPCPSSRIEVPNSLLNLGGLSKKGLGTQVKLSTTFHPQIDDQAELTIQTLKDMLRSCVINFNGKDHLPLIEFYYNNIYHSCIPVASFKDIYNRRYQSPVGWF